MVVIGIHDGNLENAARAESLEFHRLISGAVSKGIPFRGELRDHFICGMVALGGALLLDIMMRPKKAG